MDLDVIERQLAMNLDEWPGPVYAFGVMKDNCVLLLKRERRLEREKLEYAVEVLLEIARADCPYCAGRWPLFQAAARWDPDDCCWNHPLLGENPDCYNAPCEHQELHDRIASLRARIDEVSK